jgi:hypothetical protein
VCVSECLCVCVCVAGRGGRGGAPGIDGVLAGYQYRLCPAEKMPCTEQDFQQMPLEFVRDAHAIMWNNGSLYPIEGKFVDDSVCDVVPKGSTW